MNDAEDNLSERLLASRAIKYVGFVDVLGFGDLVLRDYSEASRTYGAIVRASRILRERFPKNMPAYAHHLSEIQFWSDSAVVVSSDLRAVIEGCQDLQTGALLAAHTLVRGCIAKGGHADYRTEGDTFVVSDALARAVRGEKAAHHPRIVLDRESGVEVEARALVFQGLSSVLYADDGYLMVQPFLPDYEKRGDGDTNGVLWYGDILDDVVRKYSSSPHRSKYEWMRSQLRRVDEHIDALAELDPSNDDDGIE
jgi:hypothetical protein